MDIYLDNAATTKPSRDVIDAICNSMEELYGNPSSIHRLGVQSEKKINECRENIAKTINCKMEEIYFTSGGSEGNNLVLKGLLKEGSHIITTPFEHSSIKNTVEVLEKMGVKVTYLSLDEFGQIDIEELREAIRKDTVLVSIIYVNNEVGSIQKLKEIGEVIRASSNRAKFHVDAVQGYGKLPIDVKSMNIDALTASGHKINGPKGVGFCYLSKGINLIPSIHGGAQEKGLRAGTENLHGIIGFSVAAQNIMKDINDNYKKVYEIKRYMIDRLSEIKDIRINSMISDDFSPYILNVSFRGVRGEVLLHLLEDANIFVSTGSACTSTTKGGVMGSHVLEAMKLSKQEVEGAIRFSFSPQNTIEEIDKTIDTLKRSLVFLRRIRR